MSAPPEVGTDSALTSGSAIFGHVQGVQDAYRRWFGAGYDFGALDCVLCTAAAERLTGDPAWLLVVGGPGAAKTETIMPLIGAGAHSTSTISGEAALLSGTPKKEQAEDATGGLLRKLGDRGILVIKDVTTILEMSGDARAEVLAALREVYDGKWSREIGSDGGTTLDWKGRIVVIGAVTTAWDAAHQVISTMGDRFPLVRLNSRENRKAAGRQAMRNTSRETTMRRELRHVVGELLDEVDPDAGGDVTEEEENVLLDLADVVTHVRTGVERNGWEPSFAHDLEMPTRFTKQLCQIVRGGIALGMPRERALRAAVRVANDSLPPQRRRVLLDVHENGRSLRADVEKRMSHVLPRSTVRRVMTELHLLGVFTVDSPGDGKHDWYRIADEVNPNALDDMSNFCRPPGEGH